MTVLEKELDLEDLRHLCEGLAPQLRAGDNLLLHGPMGSGKTQFTRLLVRALASCDTVTSPTYGLANFYETQSLPVLHIDTYRLETAAEYHQLGLNEFYESHLTLVEWGEKVASDFEDSLNVSFAAPEYDSDGEATSDNPARVVKFEWSCARWNPVMQDIKDKMT